jgi:hypothetical protein
MKASLALLAFLAAGFFLGRWTAPTPATPESPTPKAQTEVAVPPLRPSVSEPQKKVAVANDTAAAAPSVPTTPASSTTNEGDPSDDGDFETPSGSPASVIPGQAAISKFFADNFDPRILERLEQRRRNNATRMIAKSTPLSASNATARGLIGKFEGDILMDEATSLTWQITMETTGAFSNNHFVGTSQIQLVRNGRPFVTSNRDGTLKNFRSTGGNNSAVLIQINESFYLDAIYDGGSDSVSGNFYGKNSQGQFRFRGPAYLVRR